MDDMDAVYRAHAQTVYKFLLAQCHDPDSAEEGVLEQEGGLSLLRQIHQLPELQREVVYLRAFGNLSFREIGDVLGKTENWARVTFYRSKEKLRNGGTEDEK